MNLTIDRRPEVVVVRVHEPRLTYPVLGGFGDAVLALFRDGARQVLLEFTAVTYIDSATVGCLMDLYRQAAAVGGVLKLSGVQRRVETMLTMTGAQNFLEIHDTEKSALQSFGARQ